MEEESVLGEERVPKVPESEEERLRGPEGGLSGLIKTAHPSLCPLQQKVTGPLEHN